MLIGILILGGISMLLLRRSQRELEATKVSAVSKELLFTAESGLGYNYLRMSADPAYAVTGTSEFTWDAAKKEFHSAPFSLTPSGTTKRQQARLRIQYLKAAAPVTFADRTKPVEDYDQIKVTSTGIGSSASRTVVARYTFEMSGSFAGAVVSDMAPTGAASGKAGARKGNVCFAGGNATVVFGDLKSNGEVYRGNAKIDDSNASQEMATLYGRIDKNLSGTQEEIPDFTNLGGPDQLFDFARFEAAATAGAGQVFTRVADFIAAMKAAGQAGRMLEGITIVKVNPVTEGGSPKIDAADLPNGIHIVGTLVFRFADGTDPDYRVELDAALNVNAADLSGFDPFSRGSYTTGYPGKYTVPGKRPSSVALAPAFASFQEGDDLPAVMFNNAVVDIRGPANVCGVLYGPSSIEIENKKRATQYFSGAIFGGGGIYLEGADSGISAVQAVRYDPDTIKRLATMGSKGKTLKRSAYQIVQ